MENKGIINCPNCNQRIFADSKKCPSCKYSLEKKENNFDKAQYDFLYYTYEKNRDKQATIKLGMEKFNLSMQEIKRMVDYAAEEVYNKEEAEKSAIPKEELPTNGVDYSKVKYNKNGLIKMPKIKIIGVIVYLIVVLVLAAKAGSEKIQKGLIVAFFAGIVVLIGLMKYRRSLPGRNTYIFSFSQYLIHNLIYKIILMIILIWIPINYGDKIPVIQNTNNGFGFIICIILYAIGYPMLFFSFLYQLMKKTTEEFTVEHGTIRYKYERTEFFRNTLHDPDSMVHRYDYSTDVYYDINSITEVEETLNSIIIYGNIEKTIVWTTPGNTQRSTPKKLEKLKVTKSFKNNKNLIKSLKLCIKEK